MIMLGVVVNILASDKQMYDRFKGDIEIATNEINQRLSIKTTRKGFGGFRDNIVFYKMAVTFAYAYIAVIQSLIIFLGVTPQAIININNFFNTIGIPFGFPVDISSMVAVVIIFGLFIFGILAILILGLYKREQEIGTLQQPGFYLSVKQGYMIIDLLNDVKKELETK